MNKIILFPNSRIVLIALVILYHCNCLNADPLGLGTIDFPASGTPKAQEHFIEGVLLLHSFEYEDAREAFQKAQDIDPNFAMAYWGEAMSYNHPIWFRQNREAAVTALNRLGSSPESRAIKAPTTREKAYLHAAEVLFGEGDKKTRDLLYEEVMRQNFEQFPEDLEAASFYALSILGTSHGGRNFSTYMRAAGIVEEVYEKNPEHPGGLHYLIHCYDDPVHAPLGLRAARIYAKIAPNAAHAVHMPSHIFLALGMWEEVASSNEDSTAAGDERMKRKGLNLGHRHFHSLWWQQYSYLQLGRFREAKKLLKEVEEASIRAGTKITRYHLATMRAAYLIETRNFDRDIAQINIETSDLDLRPTIRDLFAIAYGYVLNDNTKAAEKILVEMKNTRLSAIENGNIAWTDTIEAAMVMEKEMAALIDFSKSKSLNALTLMKEAIKIEDGMKFGFGPPVVVKPSHELLGELLLKMNRPKEAQKEFELSLDRAPNRFLSLLGKARAASNSGNDEIAEITYKRIRKIWHRSDPGLLELEGVDPAKPNNAHIQSCGGQHTEISALFD